MIDELYQQAILQLSRAASGAGRLDRPDGSATVDNPLCGDRITLDLSVDDGRLIALGHKTRGCLLCEAAISLLGRDAPGRPIDEIIAAGRAFAQMIRHDGPVPEGWPGLHAFTPVKAVRGRHECVLLPFTAVEAALRQAGAPLITSLRD